MRCHARGPHGAPWLRESGVWAYSQVAEIRSTSRSEGAWSLLRFACVPPLFWWRASPTDLEKRGLRFIVPYFSDMAVEEDGDDDEGDGGLGCLRRGGPPGFGFRFSRKFVHLQTIHNRNMSNVSAGEALLSLKGDAGSGATLSHDLPARNCWGSDSERLPLRIDPSSTFLPLPREWATGALICRAASRGASGMAP